MISNNKQGYNNNINYNNNNNNVNNNYYNKRTSIGMYFLVDSSHIAYFEILFRIYVYNKKINFW